ncbi:MAG TPA: mechanosensitive ion channel domain-containing protein, partial [Candidatus Eremiobacteraceae bacterium]|nr:mechanosensitive ion channel domain-containing protein [Candidatus Eremiobacteraceae bacterium]
PALWSAGLVTAALAFGLQGIVRDVVTGFLFLFEDQYDVGDGVELTTAGGQVVSGSIESMGLRTTTVVDRNGRNFVIPNGSIALVQNDARRPGVESFTLTVPWRADATAMRERLLAHVRAAIEGGGGSADGAMVDLVDFSSAGPVFRVRYRIAPGDPAAPRIRERLAARLQGDGWLPAGSDAREAQPADPR